MSKYAMCESTLEHNAQRGASLIELMVGMTIGLVVVLAAVGSLMVTRTGSVTVADSFRVQQAGLSTMRLIASTIRQAGSAELVQTNGQNTAVQLGNLALRAVGASAEQLVSGTDGGGAAPDTLVVSYQHRIVNTAPGVTVDPGVTRDCLGNTPGAVDARIDNTFFINPAAPVELRCTGSVNPAAPQALVGDNTRPLADVAVEDFQVWYWVEPIAALGSNQRVTAAGVAVLGGWGQVRSVEVCLQLRGTRADYPIAGTFNNCQGNDIALDGRLHQAFRGTYRLRNTLQ